MNTVTMRGRCALTSQPLEVIVSDGRIEQVRVVDAVEENLWLAPGFVDLQVNGFGGFDVNADHGFTEDTVAALAESLLAVGTTAFLPTIITADEEKIVRALQTIANARHRDSNLILAVPGIHMEGPHIAPEDGARGAHPLFHVRPPDIAEFDRWQKAADGLIRLVTLSPHWPDAPAYIRELTMRGVRVALGHTHAGPEQIRAAVEAGATLSTHLGNGLALMLARHPNPIWAQLAEDRLHATFIADGHHLPADTLKVMLRAKTIERSILVSDSVALAGMPPGMYETPVGGRVELYASGRLSMAGTAFLAGAALPLKDDIAWLLREKLCTLQDAVQMASVNPTALLNLPAAYAQNAPARLIAFRLDTTRNVLRILTAVCGQITWLQESA
jgi:N-acetylglucosamine-6-phosphate deacetylase